MRQSKYVWQHDLLGGSALARTLAAKKAGIAFVLLNRGGLLWAIRLPVQEIVNRLALLVGQAFYVLPPNTFASFALTCACSSSSGVSGFWFVSPRSLAISSSVFRLAASMASTTLGSSEASPRRTA